jgi:hypothetical protein
MYYIKWDETDIKGLFSISGSIILFTEMLEDGTVSREIGFDKLGKITHRYPSNYFPHGMRGLFDDQKVHVTDLKGTISKDEFEVLWGKL